VALKFLPESVDASTVKVTGKGKVPGRIKSMNVEDHHEQESNKAEIEKREKELEAMREKDAVLQRKAEYHQARKSDLVNLREQFLQHFPFVEADDYPAKYLLQAEKLSIPSPKAGLDDFLKNVDVAIAATAGKAFALADEQAELRERIDVAQRQLDQLRNKSGIKTYKQVVLDVSAQKEGEFSFTIEYVIHAGYWTPLYEVYLAEESAKVDIKVIAGVTNDTGEDWDDVWLTVSSADLHPVVMREPDPWVLREWRPMPSPKAGYFGRRDSSGAVGGMPPPAPSVSTSASMVDGLLPVENKQVVEKPTAEVGGGAAAGVVTFKLPSKLSVKQGSFRNNIYLLELSLDGKAEFFYSTDDAKLIVQNVIKNGDMELLPGQAKIYVGDDYIGETTVNDVLPGEEFTLGTRESHELKIEKKLVDRSTDKGGLAKGKVVKFYSYEVTVEILADAARKNELVLMDRIPFSDSELVKVDGPNGLQYQPEESKLGVMKFRLKLADQDKKFKIAYTYEVSYDKDVILDTGLP
ncbi:MAG: mucoidy inhibitor MuiA family protein, partial [Candidatus Lokiarchaeota archaeon]|nr:mucoidy inhibitor MuiA family protein [Candidatus Lokiarchaeota archaeon]